MKKKGRGPGRKVAGDTLMLIQWIRMFQEMRQDGEPEGSAAMQKFIKKLIAPGLVAHALSNRFDELYRASEKYGLGMLSGEPCSQAHREIGIANWKYQKVNGRPPTMKEWRAEYLAMRNPGYRVDMRTFRWIAKQTGWSWTRVRSIRLRLDKGGRTIYERDRRTHARLF